MNYVVLAVPLTNATQGMVDRDVLLSMATGAHLVNVSRGQVIDERALLDVLATRHISATLDVFHTEPLPADHPLWDVPGVSITPHVAGEHAGLEREIMELFAANLDRWVAGRRLENMVALSRWG
jgi:phosphoglycerate dehydrogenase-like enzyme